MTEGKSHDEPTAANRQEIDSAQECQWCGLPVRGRDHHATQWECIELLKAAVGRILRERDYFEQRCHAYQGGEL